MEKFIFIFFVIFFSNFSFSENFTEKDVELFLIKKNYYFVSKDIKNIEKLLTDSIKIYSNVKISGSVFKYDYDKKSYLSALKTNWAKVSDYRYEVTSNTVNLVDSKIASVVENVSESAILDDIPYTINSIVTTELEYFSGKILATNISAISDMN